MPEASLGDQGQYVLLRPARLKRYVTTAISDVPGDDPAVIGSGPTVADPTSFAEARAILAGSAIAHRRRWRRSPRRRADEQRSLATERHAQADYVLIATPERALEAAAAACRERGITPVVPRRPPHRGTSAARHPALVHAAVLARKAAATWLIAQRARK